MRTHVTSFVAGMLFANSLPHLATMITRRSHFTPLRGRNSGPASNGLWAILNLSAGTVLLQASRQQGNRFWAEDLHAFEFGSLTFAAWMAVSERLFAMNTPAGSAGVPVS